MFKTQVIFFFFFEETGPFKAFLSTLQSNISALHASLVEVNVAQLSDDLLELNLVELDNEVKFYFTSREKLCRISNSTRYSHNSLMIFAFTVVFALILLFIP